MRHCENDEAAQCSHEASLRCWDTCSTGPNALPRRLADSVRVLYAAFLADATVLEFPGGLASPHFFLEGLGGCDPGARARAAEQGFSFVRGRIQEPWTAIQMLRGYRCYLSQ